VTCVQHRHAHASYTKLQVLRLPEILLQGMHASRWPQTHGYLLITVQYVLIDACTAVTDCNSMFPGSN
jgi:hypothetical protein